MLLRSINTAPPLKISFYHKLALCVCLWLAWFSPHVFAADVIVWGVAHTDLDISTNTSGEFYIEVEFYDEYDGTYVGSSGVLNPGTHPSGETWQMTGGGEGDAANGINYTVRSIGGNWTASGSGFVDYDNPNIYCHFRAGSSPTPTPIPGANIKPTDKKEGGNECDKSVGMARYSVHSKEVSLNVQDTPVSYAPPRGPAVDFTVTYNQREDQQPATFTHSNLGSRWTFNWLSYVTDDPATQLPTTPVFLAGGGAEIYAFNSSTQTFGSDPQSHATLVRTGSDSYEKRLPDGSKQVFGLSDGATAYPRRIFMTQSIDPAGDSVTIGYDSNKRITTITDALGQVTILAYELAGDSLKVTKVTDPFGRFASFEYTNGKLTKITDTIGIQSEFGYVSGTDSINALTTPYGTTTFVSGESGASRWIDITDPLGGKERVEYRDQAPGIGATEAGAVVPSGFTSANANLDVRNTFYWSKKALSLYPPVNGVYDYTKAKITHWLLTPDGSATSGIAASEKMPLENRVWYSHLGQSDYFHAGPSAKPSQIARVLDDGSSQLWQHEYNSLGNATKATGPLGRVTSYTYATNEIDLLTVYQRRPGGASTDPSGAAADKLAGYTYNSAHQPLTATDAAAQTTTYTYNAFGQIETVTNAKNETTTYAYGPVTNVPTGYLASITSPPFGGSSAVTSFGYDTANRVRTVKRMPDDYTTTTDYDNLDRAIKVTYPDTTFQEFKYTDNVTAAMTLDLTGTRDRRARWTYHRYNANRQMISVKDPLNRETLYGWCTCGALESITDPRLKVTTFVRDLQSRVTSKIFYDTKSISYVYENTTSRLKSMTDALNQTTNYQYFSDDTLQQVSYTNAIRATPTVTYTYDPNYNRLSTRVDGSGTTTYSYHAITATPPPGAGQLQSVDGPLLNDTITYGYDELGRVISRSLNGIASSVSFDALGRPGTSNNALGQFTRGYDGVTARLQTLTFPNGQSTAYSYFDNNTDRRLQTLQSFGTGGTNVWKHDYTYDDEGQIQTWAKQLGANSSVTGSYIHDLADQLTSASNATIGGSLPANFSYGYDFGSNRTSDNTGSYSINDVNQITNAGFTYDFNGNQTSDGVRSFEWDAANRLARIIYPANQGWTELTYDGLGRRSKVLEKDKDGNLQRQAQFIWQGMEIAEERNGSNAVIRRFLPDGIVDPQALSPNSKLFYSRDHLGSVRSLTNENGILLGTLDYDPSGRISRAPVPANDTSQGPVITGAVSRLSHGAAGSFDVELPLSGVAGIEMRRAYGNHTMVLTFDRPVASATGASVVAGVGTVGTPTFSGNTATVPLTGLADRQTVTLELSNVAATGGGTAVKVSVAMSLLMGDVNQDGTATVEDVTLVRSSSGTVPNSTTFKRDVTLDGVILSGDITLVRNSQNQGGSLFPLVAYTGHYYHARSGLYLAPYRAYSPTIGRWLSRDPIGERGGLNLYGYVLNNPVDLWDPTGENPVAGALIGLGLGGPVGAVIGAGIGTGIVVIGGAAVVDWWRNRPSPPPQVDSTGFPPGYWPGDRGAEEWGRRNDVDPREARGRFHGIKQGCPGSKPKDKYGVNPETGDVIDPEGENAGNLGEVKSK